MDKYLSIITNFGCHGRCPYCVVRENGINVPETTLFGLGGLNKAIEETGANIVSVSGGGDPLHNYNEHKYWYTELFAMLINMNLPLEMHTSYLESKFPYEKCKRVVYHLLTLDQLDQIERRGKEIIRVVYVVEKWMTKSDIEYIYDYVQRSHDIDELSFRQLVNGDFEEEFHLHDYLKQHHGKKWHYIEQNDYNDYYVEGNLYKKFSDIGKLTSIEKFMNNRKAVMALDEEFQRKHGAELKSISAGVHKWIDDEINNGNLVVVGDRIIRKRYKQQNYSIELLFDGKGENYDWRI